MKRFTYVAVTWCALSALFSQDQNKIPLIAGLGNVELKITGSGDAQKYFSQGMALCYGFNHDDGIRSFQLALDADPNCAMAYWGIAYASGPNYNLPVDADHEKAAFDAIQKAKGLTAKVSPKEKDYIETMAIRYTNDGKADFGKLNVDYKNAAGKLMQKYPDDMDAAVLFAESMMILHPWQLWFADGKPNEGTEEIVSVLESVLKKNPNHIGGNHFYIHAVEASKNPERALPCADRLPSLANMAGHLVHMPAHIYQRVGDYSAAAGSNEAAVDADNEYLKSAHTQGIYTMMYYSHNLHFLASSHAMQGRYADAKKASDDLAAHVNPMIKDMPMIEGFSPMGLFVMARFHKWDEILKLTPPDTSTKIIRSFWFWARGLAFAGTNKIAEAEAEQKKFQAMEKSIPYDSFYGLNPLGSVFKVADPFLAAKIAAAKKDFKSASGFFQQAIVSEDSLGYDEPADWQLPVREAYGAMLWANKDCAGAEKAFREDLSRNLKNGRSLFGLIECLKAQGKKTEADKLQKDFDAAWKYADTKLKIEDL